MENLPDSLLDRVFCLLQPLELLRSCALVSRHWNELVTNRVLVMRNMQHLRLVYSSMHAVYVVLPGLYSALPSQFDFMNELVLRAPILVELTMGADVPLDGAMLSTLHCLPRLRHLDVFTTAEFDKELLPVLMRLHTLVINNGIKNHVLHELTMHRGLRGLHLYGCQMNRYYYYTHHILKLISACDLRELTLRCKDLQNSDYEIIGTCANLTSLQLYSCRFLKGRSAVHVTRPRQLKRLHVTGAHHLRGPALSNLLINLPRRVTDLALSGSHFSNEHTNLLPRYAKRLQELELWKCHITTEGVVSVVPTLRHLKYLNVEVALSLEQLRQLAAHPSLIRVQCAPLPDAPDVFTTCGLRVVSARAQYALPCMVRSARECSRDGFRASFCYYWMQHWELQPAVRHAVCSLVDAHSDPHYRMFSQLALPGASYVTHTATMDGIVREYYRHETGQSSHMENTESKVLIRYE